MMRYEASEYGRIPTQQCRTGLEQLSMLLYHIVLIRITMCLKISCDAEPPLVPPRPVLSLFGRMKYLHSSKLLTTQWSQS